MPRIRPPKAQEVEIEVDDPTPPTEDVVIEFSDDELDAIPPLPGGDPSLHQEEPATPAAQESDPSPDDALRAAIEAQQRAEKIQQQLQRERDEAIRRAAERDAELARAQDDRATAEYASVLTGIAAEESVIERAEAEYAAAMQAADYALAAKAQREMATAASRLDRLQLDKKAIDQQKEATRSQPAPERRTAPQGVQEQIDAMPVPAEAKVWLRQHPDLVTDPSKNEQLGVLHGYITKVRNIVPFSKEYFDELDTNLGFRKEPVISTQPAAPAAVQPPQRRSMPVTAPVTRDVPTSTGQRQSSATSMTLTAEERFIARNAFTDPTGKMTNAEKEKLYAINKAKLARERASGRYPARERA